jgi:hypothetical protein
MLKNKVDGSNLTRNYLSNFRPFVPQWKKTVIVVNYENIISTLFFNLSGKEGTRIGLLKMNLGPSFVREGNEHLRPTFHPKFRCFEGVNFRPFVPQGKKTVIAVNYEIIKYDRIKLIICTLLFILSRAKELPANG